MVRLLDVVDPAPEAWRELLAADPEAGVAQTPEWLDAVCAVGPYRDASRLYRFDDGRRVLLPLAARKYVPSALAVASSWPFDWGIGGLLADGPVDAQHTTAVYADLAAARPLRLTIRLGPFADPAWQCTPPVFRADEDFTQSIDLSGGFGRLWDHGFRGSVRRAVRKAEASGLRVEVDRTGRLVGMFDDLYRQSVARWAEQQHEPLALAKWRSDRANPRRKFAAVARTLGERCAIWAAWRGTEPVAAIIVLRHGAHARYWRGAMNRELATPSRANDLLHRLAIEDACEAGCRRYHMGGSRPGSGLAAFKAGFGAEMRAALSYRLERLPLTEIDARLRAVAKRGLRFRDS